MESGEGRPSSGNPLGKGLITSPETGKARTNRGLAREEILRIVVGSNYQVQKGRIELLFEGASLMRKEGGGIKLLFH